MKEQDSIEMDVADNDSQEGERNRMDARKQSQRNEASQEGEVSLKLGSEKKSNYNPIIQFIIDSRRCLYNSFFSNNWVARTFWVFILNLVALAVLIASIVTARKRKGEIDWCTGVGFLWIIFGLTYYGILYYLGKHYFGRHVSKLLRPVFKCLKKVKSNRFFQLACYCTPPLVMGLYVIISPGRSGKRIFSFIGILVFISLGFLFSKYPNNINWRPVVGGIVLQLIFGWLSIRNNFGKDIVECLGLKLTSFLAYTDVGTEFVYGFLAQPENSKDQIFAFSALPVIFFLSFVVSVLNYYGALQFVILKIAWVMKVLMGTTVCESVNAAASVFLSMTEAPLLIKSYLEEQTKSEICAILCSGWSTVAGVVMAAYIKFGISASYLISASIMSAPASLSVSKLLYPETEVSKTTLDNIQLHKEEARNVLDAGTKGALSGVMIIGSIIANLVAFLGFVGFLDGTLQWIGHATEFENLSFQFLLSKIFYPVSFLMGIEEESMELVAYLIGIKTVANEFQAYRILAELVKEKKLSERTEIIATYALCGFSNFASIGITIGAMSSLAPKKLSEITEVSFIAFVAANMVCFLTACIAGCFID